MKLHPLVMLFVGFLIAADAPKDDLVKKDLDQLQGTWTLVSGERDGKKLPENKVKKTKIAFLGGKFLFPDASA